ncbi:hypothetical protein VCHA51O444_10606 [Vibrio chagasii]|nr:hypothetical protein VCHA51O444_10606 [Vibrio chagasii]CAH7358795.1 hypothetical protein VCHA53O474_30412 [Vibrio chagasii]
MKNQKESSNNESVSAIFEKVRQVINNQFNNNDLCPTDVEWIDRQDLLEDINKLEIQIQNDSAKQ